MQRRQPQFAAVFLAFTAAISVCALPAYATGSSGARRSKASAAASIVSGSIAGIVRDAAGLPRAGAAVLLLDRYERVIEESVTNAKGIFGFPELNPDSYSIRVSLATFVPALKQRISVQPGMQSLLFVNMAALISSVELVYAVPGQGALMNDDWKWTLKSSTATRPVLRLRDEEKIPGGREDSSEGSRTEASIFSDTLGLIRISAGDSDGASAGMAPDLGTAFALATSLYGRNRVQLSGNFGYMPRTGLPQGGFRTTFSRAGSTPELSLTLRQLYVPNRAGSAGLQDAPALRTITLGMNDHLDLSDNIRIEYGVSLDSISFLDRLNYSSPYARLTYRLGSLGVVQAAYSSGVPPVGLRSREPEAELQLHQDLNALSTMPVVSLRDSRVRVERTENVELGYQKRLGSRTVYLSGFHESVSNASLTASAPGGLLPAGDLLPDFSSSSSFFNIGSYRRFGYAASVVQSMGDHVEAGVSYGDAGVLVANGGPALDGNTSGDTATELRSRFRTTNHHWASARLSAKLPGSGTELTASYEWTDPGAILLSHYYMTQGAFPQPGCNLRVRQPLPSFFGMPGRLEATAELQNLLAQGYVSVPSSNGQRVVLTQVPRAIRGGLSFVF